MHVCVCVCDTINICWRTTLLAGVAANRIRPSSRSRCGNEKMHIRARASWQQSFEMQFVAAAAATCLWAAATVWCLWWDAPHFSRAHTSHTHTPHDGRRPRATQPFEHIFIITYVVWMRSIVRCARAAAFWTATRIRYISWLEYEEDSFGCVLYTMIIKLHQPSAQCMTIRMQKNRAHNMRADLTICVRRISIKRLKVICFSDLLLIPVKIAFNQGELNNFYHHNAFCYQLVQKPSAHRKFSLNKCAVVVNEPLYRRSCAPQIFWPSVVWIQNAAELIR